MKIELSNETAMYLKKYFNGALDQQENVLKLAKGMPKLKQKEYRKKIERDSEMMAEVLRAISVAELMNSVN